ncbi:hypothetical protein S7711_11180 [Stachybotrys chartarum IBT 7711]|uniref:Uncharacterized protein n=1 Tax=Stachybotrys chartarum (strain CBS 109288 / IBT 7711) TaxID=1280523 RepID=A0A084AWG2_STACB|nr:hypothetical protein S7711_11180 [Stachybotrys chartarum IBT 7711]KFA52009.1 hypothetical protein S40293_11212 [Stachybotrys chartarum IBT 40293]
MGGWTGQKDSSSLWMDGDGERPKRTLDPPHLPPAEAARLNRGLSGRLSAEAADLEVSWRNHLSRRSPAPPPRPGQPAVLPRVSTRQSFWNNIHKDEDTGGQGQGQHPTPTHLAHVDADELPSLPFLHVAQRCTHSHALDVDKFQPWLRRSNRLCCIGVASPHYAVSADQRLALVHKITIEGDGLVQSHAFGPNGFRQSHCRPHVLALCTMQP